MNFAENKNAEYHQQTFSDLLMILRMVRVVIQNFLKKPVISTVFKADE